MKDQEIILILVAAWAIVEVINGIIGLRKGYRLSQEIKMRRKEMEEVRKDDDEVDKKKKHADQRNEACG